MKAIVQDRYGSPDQLELQEIPPPAPDASHLLVQVRSASVNALDYRVMRGRPLVSRLMGIGFFHPKSKVRGVDVAGRIAAVPNGESRFRVGDEVFGFGDGTFAEYAAAEEGELELKGPSISFSQAATLGVAACTALQALRDVGRVRSGQRVLITGAASGVGTFAVQVAKLLGAHVTAMTSSGGSEMLRSLGADEVLDPAKEDPAERAKPFDVILDISGAGPLRTWRRRVAPGGVFILVGLRRGIGRFVAASLLRRFRGYPFKVFIAKPRAQDLRFLRELVEKGSLRPVLDRTYALSDVPAAMKYAEDHRAHGKIVINVAT